MRKPEGYENAPSYMGGEGGPQLPPGGYICKIKQAREETTQGGYWMLAVAFDIAEGPMAGFYEAQFKERIKRDNNAKWPGVYRQGIQNKEGKCSPFFKGMITAIEQSNPGYTFDFNESTLTGKVFGGVFAPEEWMNQQGELRTSVKLQQFRSAQAIRDGDYKVPDTKRAAGSPAGMQAPAPAAAHEPCPF